MTQTAGKPSTRKATSVGRNRSDSTTGVIPGTGAPQRAAPSTSLPSGRAVLGGFLIAASGVGLFAAYQQANAAPVTRFVVATRALAPGEIIERDDLGLAPADVPPEMAEVLSEDWRPLVGLSTTAAVGRNQFLDPGSLAQPGTSDGPSRRVSLELTRAGAIDGALQSGAIVDVLASADGDDEATVVARRARVVTLNDSAAGDLGQLGSLIVTLELPTEKSLRAVVGANASGTVTLAAPAPASTGESGASEGGADADPDAGASDAKPGGGSGD